MGRMGRDYRLQLVLQLQESTTNVIVLKRCWFMVTHIHQHTITADESKYLRVNGSRRTLQPCHLAAPSHCLFQVAMEAGNGSSFSAVPSCSPTLSISLSCFSNVDGTTSKMMLLSLYTMFKIDHDSSPSLAYVQNFWQSRHRHININITHGNTFTYAQIQCGTDI